ncbi:MAG TPA: helix-turn-helix transcriptional regulator [Oligoflexus sp.]|uniref:helix-turn-helix transcriptional regulator n=1 Tax=Oligoflexus sp. TaxID=1971216 RepID=UPI002D31E4B9|nr:helix-turn-helix transcriptional regulator [Oligoflexus sp.]HYX33948.1 helix-turn-helix transcriptional regulator [Oligoflexus sp.]
MHSSANDLLPPRIRRALTKLGSDIALARRKRGLTIAMMIERIGVAKQTYQRVEQGDPAVAMGTYAMAIFVLGLGDKPFDIADPSQDEQGLLLDAERTPKRVRAKKEPTSR